MFEHYNAAIRGEALVLAEVVQFGRFIQYQQALDLSAAETFWCDNLHDFDTPLPLSKLLQTDDPHTGHGVAEARLSAKLTQSLQAVARQQKVTLNILIQAAWSLLIGRYSFCLLYTSPSPRDRG